uniref:HORMA domain-containing protein n=1 Tax=Lutzomyia longipalpis TaxID=7200 RepID=A0A1B0CE88_LUTLO
MAESPQTEPEEHQRILPATRINSSSNILIIPHKNQASCPTLKSTVTSCITLSGSAAIICEYLNFGVNSVLFQRGIYPPESFSTVQQYGLMIFILQDEKITEILKNDLSQAQDWIAENKVEKISLVIKNSHTAEMLEFWDFKIDNENENIPTKDGQEVTSSKDLKRIQNKIRYVLRQLSATVSFLPPLDCICSFDILIYTHKYTKIPEQWENTEGVQSFQLKSYSTGLHQLSTVINYKMNL